MAVLAAFTGSALADSIDVQSSLAPDSSGAATAISASATAFSMSLDRLVLSTRGSDQEAALQKIVADLKARLTEAEQAKDRLGAIRKLEAKLEKESARMRALAQGREAAIQRLKVEIDALERVPEGQRGDAWKGLYSAAKSNLKSQETYVRHRYIENAIYERTLVNVRNNRLPPAARLAQAYAVSPWEKEYLITARDAAEKRLHYTGTLRIVNGGVAVLGGLNTLRLGKQYYDSLQDRAPAKYSARNIDSMDNSTLGAAENCALVQPEWGGCPSLPATAQ